MLEPGQLSVLSSRNSAVLSCLHSTLDVQLGLRCSVRHSMLEDEGTLDVAMLDVACRTLGEGVELLDVRPGGTFSGRLPLGPRWPDDLVAAHEGLEVGSLHLHFCSGSGDVPVVALQGCEYETRAPPLRSTSRASRLRSLSSWLVWGTAHRDGRRLAAESPAGRSAGVIIDGGAQHTDAVHDVLEFPHVAGPRVVQQQVQCARVRSRVSAGRFLHRTS